METSPEGSPYISLTVVDLPMVDNVPSRWPVNGCRRSWQWLVSSPCSGWVASCILRLTTALSNWRAATCMSTFLALFIYPYTLSSQPELQWHKLPLGRVVECG
jgi:hypothetical protein